MAGQDRPRQAFGDRQALIYSGVTNTAQKEGWRLVLSVPLEVYVTCGTSVVAGVTWGSRRMIPHSSRCR
ncbi:hypothetical protein M378DRAFT_173863 [Amanita muscaria Koide BX008]|uniref:Uncharacterized protein n=1 Tax=Amanita muscaria (strain Koide BX008) TaxID=946122 RepID=A0A0C2RXP3_AMAMK|nr:hypothetical protein M378DRAFT_173863 [Amanita muscaria Koide BX008]